MTPDIIFAKESFNTFNNLIFNGSLPTPRFSLTHARTFRGKLCYRVTRSFLRKKCDEFEMRLSVDFDLPRNEWEDVVIHEMIHLHIASKGIADSSAHGPVFRKIMHGINTTYDRDIKVSTRATAQQLDADKRVRAHYLCLAKFNDGRLGVAPVIKSHIFSLWDNFSRFPGVVSVKWVGTADPWFNRFPRVKSAKLYVADRAELALHLRGAMPLERSGHTIRALSRRCSPDELLP